MGSRNHGDLPALRRRRAWLEKRTGEARRNGQRPVRYDVDELRELDMVLGKGRPRAEEEPPKIPERFEEVYEVPSEPRGRRFFPGGEL